MCVRVIILVAWIAAAALADVAWANGPSMPAIQAETSPRLQSAAKRSLRLASEGPALPEADSSLAGTGDSIEMENQLDRVTPAAMFENGEPVIEEVVTPEVASGEMHFDETLSPGYADPSAWDDMDYWQQEPPAPVASSSTWFNRGRWYAKQDFVYMSRFTTDYVRLAADYTLLQPNTGIPYVAMNTPRGLGFEPGARLSLGRFLCKDRKGRDHTLEFSYLGLFDWQQSNSLTARTPGLLFSLLDPYRTTNSETPAFNSVDTQAFTYNSSFDSYELNYVISQRLGRDKLELQPNGEWLRTLKPGHVSTFSAGVRLIQIGEGMLWTSQGNNPAESGLYEVTTQNDLLGVQFGYEFVYQRSKWRLGIKSQLGSYINYADQSSFVRIDLPQNDPADRIESASSHDLAFVYDFALVGAYHIRPNISLRASYNFMFISQIALAPEQLTFNPGPVPTIVNGGALTYNGFSLGVEFVW